MSYYSPWIGKVVAMRQQVLVVFVGLCILVSFTSAGQIPFMRNINTKSQSSITVSDPEYMTNNDHLPGTILRSGQRFIHPSAASDSHPDNGTPRRIGPSTTKTASPSVDSWDRSTSDTCGGIVNVPLSFDRLTTFESSQFPEERAFPLICNWNVKVPNKKCALARITMRVDGRSRLPDVDGCAQGYYRVYPFMKEAKICGRIGDVPPLQWYVNVQQPENVTVVMENIGLGDGNPEGLSFTLQGECVDDKSIRVDKENVRFSRRWINRLMEDDEVGEGPKIIIRSKSSAGRQTTVAPIPTTTTSSSTTTKRPAGSISNGDNNIPLLHLQSHESSHLPDDSSVIYFPPSTTKTIRRTSSTTVRPPTTYLNNNPDIPWLILKSPQQTDDQSFENYPHKNQPGNKQNNNNVKQTQEMTLSTQNPWLALKSAYLRNVSSTSKSTPKFSYTHQPYYFNDPKINSRSPVNAEITETQITSDPPSTKAEVLTTGSLILTSLPTTTAAPSTTTMAETTLKIISYSTQFKSTTLNENEFNTSTTLPASTETAAATNVITSPAPTESNLDEESPENDANISYISLNGQKFIFGKLQRTFKRTYNKLRKIMS